MRSLTVKGRYCQTAPPGRFKGEVEETFQADFERSALLVVDVYGHGFPLPDGVRRHPSSDKEHDRPYEEVTLQYIRPALEAARLAGMPVVYAHNSGPNIKINRSQLGRQLARTLQCDVEELFHERGVDPREYLCREDNLFLETAPVVAPQPGDYFIRKHFYSGFKDTRLDTLLRNLDIKTLFCVGFDASVCLLCTMVDAFELNYEVVLLRDACRAYDIPEDVKIGYAFTGRIVK